MQNKRYYSLFIFIFLSSIVIYPTESSKGRKAHRRTYAKNKKMVTFDYTDKPLADIVNELAAAMNLNIILPQGALAIQTKITYHLPDPIPLEEAWNHLSSMLNLAGYTIEPEANIHIIRKTDQNINRQILSVYIAEKLENIPDDENIIRAVFYLANINLKVSWNDISSILGEMLSSSASSGDKTGIKKDDKVNALILTDKAINVKAAMRIIFELDKGGMRDSIEVIPLYYTSSKLVEQLFTTQLLTQKQQQQGGGGAPEQTSFYFPKNTKVIGLDHNNTMVIMGTTYGIDLVKDFIIKYIDRPLDSGHSILHLYDLQYLDAQKFAPVLRQFLNPGQEAQAAGQVSTGPKQYFKDVLVEAEITGKTEQIKPTSIAGEGLNGGAQPIAEGAQVGGNRLIIAARKEDWVRIKQIIDNLDKRQPQVALEVIVADVTLNNNKFLGSQMRNKDGWNQSISQRVNFQSAQLAQPVLKQAVPSEDAFGDTPAQRPANALMSNLLQVGDQFADGQNLATLAPAGSLIFSLKDKFHGVWSVWEVLNLYTNATLIAQPYVITKNHKQATVTIAQQRFLAGKADPSNVAVNVGNEWVTAAFTIDILPHISSTGNINLQITVKINEFAETDAATGNNTRFTRLVQTNSNVGNGEILALGGLTRETVITQRSELPPFSKIPIVGWLFKKVQKVKERNNLLILISPTIVTPRLKGGVDPFTDKKLEFAKEQLDESVCYENLRDPITRWFFKADPFYGEDSIKDYTHRTLHETYNGDEKDAADEESALVTDIDRPLQQKQQEAEQKLKDLIKHEKNPLLAHTGLGDEEETETESVGI